MKQCLTLSDPVFFSSDIRSRDEVELALAGPFGLSGRAEANLVRRGVACLSSETSVPSYEITDTEEIGAIGEPTVAFFTSLLNKIRPKQSHICVNKLRKQLKVSLTNAIAEIMKRDFFN